MLGLGKGSDDAGRGLFVRRRAAAPGAGPSPVELDANSEALLILKTYEESGQGWFWATDAEGRLTYISEAIGLHFADSARMLIGRPMSEFLVSCDEGDESGRTLAFLLARKARFTKLYVERASAVESPCWELSGAPFFDELSRFQGFRGSGIDVTEQRSTSRQASQMAMYDALTGLSNRRRMQQTLVATLRAFSVANRACAVMLLDLDRFKHVNDTLGHPAGDALLKQVAERLLTIVPDKEYVCRLGGDEFQITLPDVSDRGLLGELASRIIGVLSQPYLIEGTRCAIGASIGIAVSPVDGETTDELIRNADLALYAAKGAGRGRYRFFSDAFLKAAEDRRKLEEDLRDAVARDELVLYYQPVVCAATDCVTGVEALCRWNHPERGWVSPAVFIPIAEEANIIEDIGRWAIRRACMEAVQWPGTLRVSVNLSPIQFGNEELPTIVQGALSASGLAPDRLELELTEGIFLAASQDADDMFAALKAIGVRLALDDFGTGYSSLGYLRKAPFDKIKIDQSFVRGTLEEGSRNAAIIAAIVALADALGMETTAEGLESHDQLDLIRTLKVSHVQGFIYSKAVSNAEVAEQLAAGSWRIPPRGPAKQRYERQTVFRKAGAIHDDHCYPVIIRNISQSGALMQGLLDVPIGTEFVLDLGDGQFVVAKVRRSDGDLQGVEFEQQLVPDGNGGLCTRHRVSSYLLSLAGLNSLHDPKSAPDAGRYTSIPVFRSANDWTAAGRKTAA
jgi:diguanylate cyclase (GGDEF)-like protein